MDPDQIIKDKLPLKYGCYSNVFRLIGFDEVPSSRKSGHRIKLKQGYILETSSKSLESLPLSTYTEEAARLTLDFIDGLFSRGLITPSKAIATSELYFDRIGNQLVPKVSFAQLNAVIASSSFRLPTPLNLIRRTKNATIYTKLVVQNIYQQKLLDKKDAHLTTFLTPFGKYKFTTLPSGLAGATVAIQEMIDEVIDYPNKKHVAAYQDSILVFSQNIFTHNNHVKDILSCFEEYEILLDINRCEFDVPEVLFLGYKLRGGVFTINPSKAKEITDAEYPNTKAELKYFLSKVEGWAQFISGYASKSSSLYHLAYTASSFSWDQEVATDFICIKNEFTIPRWLQLPNPSLTYTIDLHFNPIAYSATLLQVDDEQEFILGYFSEQKTNNQLIYSEVDDQAYGVLLSLENWKDILNDADEAIRVRADDSHLADLEYNEIVDALDGSWYNRFKEFNFYVSPFDDISYYQ
ncbi:hypothetical protein DSO57_1039781 [Entomophthora muscae]|uniref:Uncharacterized protein n=1 Tax=Entomophthora muscae TaxID=34485 RepID=A0ACC2RKD1_9FUNG|nr:hypothetical protein DSO57_1039781 [Entomophthora muscae]